MNVLLRLSVCASACLLLGITLARTPSGWVSGFAPGLSRLSEVWLDLAEETARELDLEDNRAAVTERVMAKARLVEELVAGRRTLLQTAARFRALNSGPPRFHWEHFREAYPGATDDEKCCYEVLFAARPTPNSPDRERRLALVEQLKAELRQLVEEGTLRLRE
jgi:hypothetical protein